MKKTKAMGILSAAVLTVSMAATVNAADYAVKPDYTLPKHEPIVSAPVTTPSASEETSSSVYTSMTEMYNISFKSVATTISDSSVKSAINRGKPIVASYDRANVKRSAVAELAGSTGSVLTVVTKRYAVEIAADSVTDAKDISLAMKITKDSNKGALIIRTQQKGSFGCTVSMSVPAKIYAQAGVDLDSAAVYKIIDGTKTAVKVCDIGIDSNGNITFDITDGGSYVIL